MGTKTQRSTDEYERTIFIFTIFIVVARMLLGAKGIATSNKCLSSLFCLFSLVFSSRCSIDVL